MYILVDILKNCRILRYLEMTNVIQKKNIFNYKDFIHLYLVSKTVKYINWKVFKIAWVTETKLQSSGQSDS